MTEYLTRRVLQMIPLLLFISILSFAIAEFTPGDPVLMYLAPAKRGLSTEELNLLRHQLGLDRPVYIRYFSWITQMFQGNWGYSLKTNNTVLNEIMARLPNTLLLGGISFVFTIIVAIPIGVLSAIKRYTAIDYFITVAAFTGISMPSFFLALVLIELFSNQWHILPSVGMSTLGITMGSWESFWDTCKHLILPVITLSFNSIGNWSRYQRATLLEVLNQDYIRTARGKGLKEKVVIWQHAFRNSLIPVITLAGLSLPDLVNGAYITETVFGWPGMGRLGITAIQVRDYPIVMGVTMLSALLVVIGNLLADVSYAMVDPRIRHK
ncbi:MAG: ABC transporter permease [Chloroflexi bacterium]|nr:ABC transporter permease [Chloroflexota bacterium]